MNRRILRAGSEMDREEEGRLFSYLARFDMRRRSDAADRVRAWLDESRVPHREDALSCVRRFERGGRYERRCGYVRECPICRAEYLTTVVRSFFRRNTTMIVSSHGGDGWDEAAERYSRKVRNELRRVRAGVVDKETARVVSLESDQLVVLSATFLSSPSVYDADWVADTLQKRGLDAVRMSDDYARMRKQVGRLRMDYGIVVERGWDPELFAEMAGSIRSRGTLEAKTKSKEMLETTGVYHDESICCIQRQSRGGVDMGGPSGLARGLPGVDSVRIGDVQARGVPGGPCRRHVPLKSTVA